MGPDLGSNCLQRISVYKIVAVSPGRINTELKFKLQRSSFSEEKISKTCKLIDVLLNLLVTVKAAPHKCVNRTGLL